MWRCWTTWQSGSGPGSQRRRSTSGCMIIQQSTEGSRLLWAMRASPKRLHLHRRPGVPRDPSEDVVLKEGDIINVDVSTILHGYYSDSSRMFMIGDVGPEKEKLVRVTREAVEKGLQEVKPWGYLGDMGQAVHDHVKSTAIQWWRMWEATAWVWNSMRIPLSAM